MGIGASARRMLAVAALVVLVPAPLAAHPLHTSVAILDYERQKGTIDLSIRVFADDFERAAAQRSARRSAAQRNESPLLAYIRASFLVTDGAGRPVPLEWCGWRRQGDLVWLCFRSRNVARGDLTVADHIFHDLYDDQINVVQARNGGHSTNLLFTKSDGAKRIR
jgi:hypothetical protein